LLLIHFIEGEIEASEVELFALSPSQEEQGEKKASAPATLTSFLGEHPQFSPQAPLA
jgi:hypothetical protein